MNDWLDILRQLQRDSASSVLVTVAGTRGSTPREIGAKMVVSGTQTAGTIGGGQLEHSCVQQACQWLRAGSQANGNRTGRRLLKHFALGANCGQCCGGVADILFEEIPAGQAPWVEHLGELSDQHIPAALVTPRLSQSVNSKMIVTMSSWTSFDEEFVPDAPLLAAARQALRLPGARIENSKGVPMLLEAVREACFTVFIFGAGHVGSACATVLSLLESQVLIIDSRREFVDQPWPANVQTVQAANPSRIVADAPPGTHFLIMTHDHAVDLEICAAVLRRGDFASCGLIGSRSKRRRFGKRLRALGLGDIDIARLICPIGIDSIQGKRPAEIAVAVAAQLQASHESGVRAQAQALDQTEKDYGSVYR